MKKILIALALAALGGLAFWDWKRDQRTDAAWRPYSHPLASALSASKARVEAETETGYPGVDFSEPFEDGQAETYCRVIAAAYSCSVETARRAYYETVVLGQ